MNSESVITCMASTPRVAFFTDSFHEVNGVALTSRQFHSFAARRNFPFLSVHAGPQTESETVGTVTTLELERSSASFSLESDLAFDPLLWLHRARVAQDICTFKPDVIHVTGPGDFGMLGAYLAHQLNIPLAASWHTNIHEYAARRLEKLFDFVPEKPLQRISSAAERGALTGAAQFYKIAKVLFAPNQELVDLLHERTQKPCFLMQRGVDAELFHPGNRTPGNRPFTIGYVGRLSPEKNVRLLATIERALLDAGHSDFRFVIVGSGAEKDWLAENMSHAEFPGVLKDEALARAYADMDVFAFPSETDTFGNVILESLASGVPPVVTSGGGPKFLVNSGVNGFVSQNDAEFINAVELLMTNGERLAAMRTAAREYACSIVWDTVFEKVYGAYELALFRNLPLRAAS
jgi:glycosyltransferase involved in cell wall biosynthesis